MDINVVRKRDATPEGVSHTLINVGGETAVVSWSMAPLMK